jgi:quercetin dioxygenase-like cupin family protein
VILSGMLVIIISCNSNDRSKQATEKKEAKEMNMNLKQLAPDIFKLKSDTLGLRCFEVTFKAGDSVPMHVFPENVLYVLEPGTIEYTRADGSKSIS